MPLNRSRRPKNGEVEDEVLRQPLREGKPPRPASDPTGTSEEASGAAPARAAGATKGTKSPAQR